MLKMYRDWRNFRESQTSLQNIYCDLDNQDKDSLGIGLCAVADPGFSPGGAPTPKIAIIFHIFAENCMKMKEVGPPGGARVPGAPPWIRQ